MKKFSDLERIQKFVDKQVSERIRNLSLQSRS